MKKHIAFLLAAVMAASSLPVSAYAANFRDIHDVPWAGAEQVINSVADLGLLNGYEDNTFRARNNVTYCEAMQMVYSMMAKAGGATLDAASAYQYYSLMSTYGIPAWAQMAVAYGLSKEIISVQDLTKFTTGGSSNYATREDVAKIFGNAVSLLYGDTVDTTTAATEAAGFADYWSISATATGQVGLLKSLEIVSGDNANQFLPKNNINRAEMAVMLNKTYAILKQGIGITCTISNIVRNGDNYFFDMKMEDGTTEGFNVPAGQVKLYDGNSDTELSLSRLSVGDKVSIVHRNWELQTIRLLNAVTDQEKYDVTGYITKATTSGFTLENENTGKTDEYTYDSNCLLYLDDKKVTEKELKDIISERSDEYAYARILLSADTEKQKKDDGSRETVEVLRVTEMYVSFSEKYSATGEVTDMTDARISFKTTGAGTEQIFAYAEDCAFYIGEDKVTKEKALALGESGTVYVKLEINSNQRAEKVTLSEESFDSKANAATSLVTYEVVSYTESKIVLKQSGEQVTYVFGSTNPTKNISFYKWDKDEKEFTSTTEKKARDYYLDAYRVDDNGNVDDTVYCRVEFNSGGKLSAIYLSEVRSAWKNSSEQTDRKGTIASLNGDTLKFEGVSTAYTLLSQYNRKYTGSDRDDAAYTGNGPNGGEVRNPLIINGAATSSLAAFRKLAESENVEMTAEIVANGDREVLGIEATVVSAKGELVEFDRDAKQISIQLETGETVKLQTLRNPKLTDEDEKSFTLDDVAGTSYVGSTVELKCNSSGEVNLITVLDTAAGIGFGRLKGIAVAANDGLQMEGDSNVYKWLSRKNIILTNKSMPSESLDKLKDVIEDDAVEVYVVASLNEKKSVEQITARVQAAEGTLEEYNEDDHLIRIQTADGNKFSFHVIQKPSCNVGGVGIEDLDDDCRGKAIELIFDDEGKVSGIEG